MTETKTILVIDDDKVQRKIIESALKPHGYVSIHAKSGEEALEILETRRPGLILLDIILPGLNGFQTLKRIRRLPGIADIPVIILSILDQPEFKTKGVGSGVEDYIAKPFNVRDLATRVNAVFKKRETRRQTDDVSGSSEDQSKEEYREFPKSIFKIVENNNCPLYESRDRFELEGLSFQPPAGKPACISLVKDVDIFMQFGGFGEPFFEHEFGDPVYCGGCVGSIKMEYEKGEKTEAPKHVESVDNTVQFLSKIPLFQSFDIQTIKDLVLSVRMQKHETGNIVIRKGETGKFLYIIISGRVDVLGDSEMHIATLGNGEVFGEMSLISGDPVAATIKVMEPSKILALDGDYFIRLLNRNPAIQLYMSRLLARRLAKSNINISAGEDREYSMMGKLSDILPSVLLQTLNMNQQTGVLSLDLSGGKASIHFRDGEIIEAEYDGKQHVEAFYEIMKENEGRFKFTPGIPDDKLERPKMGTFMGLLMDGVRVADEEKAR